MLHALGLVTGDPTIRISSPFVFHPGVQITVSEPGDEAMMLDQEELPLGDPQDGLNALSTAPGGEGALLRP